jgi:hypothetical protein
LPLIRHRTTAGEPISQTMPAPAFPVISHPWMEGIPSGARMASPPQPVILSPSSRVSTEALL